MKRHNYDRRQETHPKKHQNHSTTSGGNPNLKLPIFPSYRDSPTLPPKVKLLCEIIATTPSLSVEKLLDDSGLRISPSDVEHVLKLSYSFPGPAVKFFRWAGFQLNDRHSPYAWNLVVDLLGKNSLFDAMWDAIKSMKRGGLVSLATFASVFGSYVIAGRVQEAIMTFEVMDQYGCPRDVVALNSLLSAICRDGKTLDAVDFLRVAKRLIRPDADTYAILLEGWEKEKSIIGAKETFAEMVSEIGWDPGNVPAYDTFLGTLVMGHDGLYEAIKFFNMMKDRKCYPGMKFFRLALYECAKCSDVRGAGLIWEAMANSIGCSPDTQLYNLMIALHCNNNSVEIAKKFFDAMVYNGAFPDLETYNLLFHILIKCRMLEDSVVLLNEMIKNECVPHQVNCSAAVRLYINSNEPYMAIKVWKCMIENYKSDLEETGNFLVVGLCDIHMIPEAVKYAEGMIERGIKVSSSTLSKLRQNLTKGRKEMVYEELLRKWKAY